jgi:hypothetical protein
VQHINGMPLQLIIIGMLQSFIIFIIRAQQFLNDRRIAHGSRYSLVTDMQSASI